MQCVHRGTPDRRQKFWLIAAVGPFNTSRACPGGDRGIHPRAHRGSQAWGKPKLSFRGDYSGDRRSGMRPRSQDLVPGLPSRRPTPGHGAAAGQNAGPTTGPQVGTRSRLAMILPQGRHSSCTASSHAPEARTERAAARPCRPGASSSAIGAELGLSRNAVCGARVRYGMPRPEPRIPDIPNPRPYQKPTRAVRREPPQHTPGGAAPTL